MSKSSESLEELKRSILLNRLKQRAAAGAAEREARDAIAHADRSQSLPLSWAQQRLWFLDQLDHSAGAAYHMPVALQLSGELDLSALRSSLDRIVARHENLRTRFVSQSGAPVQMIDPADTGFALNQSDLRGLSADGQAAAIRAQSREEARAPFDMAQGPLIRGRLLRLSEHEHVLLVTQHHIVSDGWSIGVLVQEVTALYEAFRQGKSDPLPPLPIQYADYAAWQRGWLQGETLQRQSNYWRERLRGAPAVLELPTDRPRPPVQSYAGDRVPVRLSSDLSAQLRSLSQRHGTTIFMTLLAGWSLLLSRLSGQSEVVVGSPVANRQRRELEPLIGFFVNTLALRVDMQGAPSVADLLSRVKATTLAAYEHQDLPFEQVVEAVQPVRSMSHSPLFQAMLTMNNTPGGGGGLSLAGLRIAALESPHPTTHFDLALSLNEGSDGIAGNLEFSTDLLDRDTVERYVGHFATLLAAMCADDQSSIAHLPLLTQVEHQAIVEGLNGDRAETGSGRLLHELIQARVHANPNAIALEFEGQSLSYGELNRRANRMAHRLIASGVKPDDRVAICAERGLDIVVGLLGILKAGGGYVPLDPAYPPERLAYMLADSAPVALVTQRALRDSLPLLRNCTVPMLDLDGQDADAGNADDPDPGALGLQSRHLAYVIYTSGSTGEPKGVMIEHASIVAQALTHIRAYALTPKDRTLEFATFSFDSSVIELFPALCAGATVVLRSADMVAPDKEFADFLRDRRLSVIDLPTAFWHQWVQEIGAGRSLPGNDLRLVAVAGEKVERRYLSAWLAAPSTRGCRWLNLYGPTEATVDSTFIAFDGGAAAPAGEVPIGRPMTNTRVYLLDENLQPVPIGVAGEIHVGGAGVARGYWNRPELTAERFVRDPFNADPQAWMYKTGDLGRWLADGTIEYLGRNDAQVKIRGFRIELGEIETQLAACEGVREAVVIAREDSPGDKRLVAYLLAHDGVVLSGAALREHLSHRLAEYMVPSAFVVLESLPLTPNGKLDRKAMPAPDQSAVLSREYEAPQGEVESAIAVVWQELLGLEQVGRHDHFFELGGHSLLAVQVASRLRQSLGLEVPLRDLFARPTPAALAAGLQGRSGASQSPIGLADRGAALPLSWAQQRLWFLDQLDHSAGAAYHMPVALRLSGDLDRSALRGSLDRIVARHENLRTRFVTEAGAAVQVVDSPDIGFALSECDLSGMSADELAASVAAQSREEARAPFDLTLGPLIRGRLLRLSESEHVLLVTQHHIVSDGWSIGVLVQEVSALYDAFRQGQPDPLPPLPIQYADYAAWQRGWLQGETLHRQSNYWREQLRGAPAVLELPTDRPRPPVQSYAGGRVPVRLSSDLSAQLRSLSQRHGTTVFMTLLAGWSILLSRLSGQSEVVVGSPVANRQRSELESLIGFFVNTLALRVDLQDAPSVADLLSRVKATTLAAYEHQDLPFEQVVEAVQPARSMSHSPLFQAMLTMNNTPGGGGLNLRGLSIESLDSGQATTHFDLELSLSDNGESIVGGLLYSTDLFDRETAERYVASLTVLLQHFAEESSTVDALPWLPAGERERVVEAFNATAAPRRIEFIHRAFEAQVRATPEAIALEFDGARLSYSELNRRANRLAHRLIGLGVKPDERVAICVERSLEMVIGLLGTLKAGGAYVPLDPSYPRDRLAYMLEDCAPTAVLMHSATRELLPEDVASPRIALDADALQGEQNEHDPEPEALGLTPRHLAYVIYTSGSTGQPKGVMNEHHAVMNRLDWGVRQFPWNASDRVLQKTPFGFDVSVWEFFQPLLSGATLVLAKPLGHQDPDYLVDLIESAGITVAHFVPSMLQVFVDRVDAGRCKNLKQLFCSGEALPYSLQQQVFAALPGVELHNLYGPTEAAIEVTYWNCAEPSQRRAVPIGRPVANTQMYVLDARGEPVPVGVAGELFIAGVQVARGYWNRPELTAERFVSDPFSADPQARMYKTGDLGRWLADGTIEYLGRNDFQVKIRGFRIELGEIEARLVACDGVREAVVIAREDVEGDKRLVAYAVMEPGVELSVAALRESLSKELAEYMVPSAFVALDALPLTPNGKLDRKALPAPDQGAVLSREYEAPQGEIETAIAEIWQDLLGLERVGRHDHFFELGGHSLLAVQVASRLRQSLGLEIPLRDLFSCPTPAALAASVQGSQSASQPPITLADRNAVLPLSWAQQRLWFLDQLDHSAGAAYHMPVALQLSGELDRAALQNSLNRIVARHENLRTRFVSQSGAPVQVIDPADTGFVLVDHDLSDLAADAQASAVATQSREEARAPFDLAQGPLIRGRLLRLSEHEHVLLVTQHHIVSDGWSIGVLVKEVSALYDAYRQGRPDPLPPLPIQYADYAAWQRGWLQGETLQRQSNYWRDQLQGAPAVLELPTDRPRPALQSYAGDRVPVRLPAELSAQLRTLSQRHGTTVFMTLLAGWSVLLSRLSGQSDVVVGSPVANRQRSELEPLIGFFVNTLALRVDLQDAPSVAGLLAQVKATTLAAYEHQDLPFEQVVEAVQPVRSMSHSPLFQALLSLNNTPDGGGLQLHGLTLSQLDSGQQTAQFDLALSLTDNGNALSGSIAYASDLFDRGTVERMMDHWTTLLTAMAADDSASVARLPLLTPPQRAQVLQSFHAQAHGDTPRQFERGVIHHGFEAQVARTPHAPAVSYEQDTLSYAELDRRANQVAHRLIELGVKPDDRVAICVERSLDMVVGLLGILKAGGGYVPLDPAYPADRLAYMLEDSAPVALLSQSALRASLPLATCPVLELDDVTVWAQSGTDTPVVSNLQPHHLAYVIYTSGSTGQPKGVMVEHGQVSRLFASTDHWFGFNETDVWTLFHSFAFDFSVWELWGALLYGGRVVIVPSLCARSPVEFYELLVREGVTVLNQTPSAFRALIAAQSEHEHQLRTIVFGGEALELSTLVPWLQRNPTSRTQLINMYGITEITVHATYRPITEADVAVPRGSPIGQAIADLRLYVLDGQGEPVPVGVTGELYVAGAGVARGYLNREELTAQRFLSDRFDPDPQARMYKTGDLGRWLADGTIEYLGRNDFQVKIRGFRIELGEIEAKLAACEGVRDAVVIAREDTPGDKRLVAYLVMREGATWSVPELREALSRDLAEYMVPSAFVALDALPLTTNGKLDRQALPAPDQASVSQREYEAAQGETETAIAEVWQDLLGLDRVGRHDHFFELGGHSLLVIGLIERLRLRGLNADVRTVFTVPVLSDFAERVLAQVTSTPDRIADNVIDTHTSRITPDLLPLVDLTQEQIDAIVASVPGGTGNVQDIYPLGPLQEGILFHHLIESERPGDAYLMRSLIAFDSRERVDSFVDALQHVISRHDILRSAPRWQGLARPVQVVHRRAPMPVELLTVAEDRPAMQTLLAASDPTRIKLDLEKAPLLRAYVVEDYATGEWLMALLNHHLVDDNYSMQLLHKEVRLILQGQEHLLAAPQPYRNFIARTHAVPDSVHEAYFRERLGDVDEPTAPFGVLNVQGSDTGAQARVDLPAATARRVREAARQQGVTPAVLFHVAWALVLSRCSGRDDVVFGTVLSGRLQGSEAADQVVGMFINTLPIRVRLGGVSLSEAIAQAYRSLGELLEHEQASLTLAQRCSAVAPPLPLFTTLINFRHGQMLQDAQNPSASSWQGVRALGTEERSNYPLGICVDDIGEGFSLTAQTSHGIDADRIVAYLHTAVDSMLAALDAEPAIALQALEILPATERERLLIEFNQASVSAEPLQEPFVHRMFEAQVAARPHAVALRDAAGECSYDELNRAANRLAHQLIAHGASRGARVAVFGERGRPMVQAFVATLKAGAVYLPVDPDYPSERLRYMLGDSEPAVVLATLASCGKVRELGYAGPMLILDEADGAIARETREHDLSVDDLALRPEHPAYMIYTSGSTGHPKAAINHHRGLAGMVKASVATLGVDRDSRMLQFASPSFDGSVFELTCALSSGATVCLGTRESLRPGAPLLEALNSYQITHVVLPSSALQACGDDAPVPTRVTLMLAGEALPPALAKRWAATNRVFNFYGPTETSVATSAHRCETRFEGSVPIGRPLSHCRVHLLDEHGRLAPIGVPGELCIGGSGVGLGYWRREDLNEERFIADPFADSFAPQAGRADARLYRSGDMARWREDGTIEYLGRNDFQIKLRGFRIELGEIEARLCEIEGVREAAVIAREDRQDTRLVAYVVGEEGVTLDVAFLRERLAQKLAEFMLPSAFVPLPALPLNQNGKLDRKALPAPDMAALLSRDYAAPASASERTLAQIWSELLGVERVGRHDHFFELGGHSLSAIKLVYLLKQRLQASLPLAAVFASPTLAALAEAVDAARGGDAPPLAPSLVVPLNAVSDAPALFCIHPIGGQIGFYRPLAQRLQSHWRVFGVQAAHDDGANLQAMARVYADAIRAEQAQGPYRLLGWSTGGLFASAVADELIAQGAQVDYLGWVDTHAMPHRDALDEGRALTEAALAELRGNGFVLREAPAQGERSIRELLQMPFDQAVPQLQRWLSPAMNVETFGHLKAQLAITQRHLQSLYAHESPSRTPTQAFWAGSGEAHTAAQASVRARSTHWIDADHYAMLSEPHVAAIADALQAFFAARSHA